MSELKVDTKNTKKKSKAPLVKPALSAHSIFGISIAAILYIICFSGILSVFKDEIVSWEQKGEPLVENLATEAAMAAAVNGFALEPETAHLFLHMPTKKTYRLIVQTDNEEHYADAQGNIAGEMAHPWSDFLIDLHYYLHLPKSFGMIVVSIFGVFLFAMSISGLIAHPNIFKDAFTFRRSKSEQLKQVDLHNRLSVWTAPFHISNSLTGTMIGLATLSAVAVGTLKYDGDFAAVFEPVFGSEPTPDTTPAPMADLVTVLNYMGEHHPEKPIVYVFIHDPKTKGQYVQVMAEHTRRMIYAEKYNFNGDGEFLGTVGSADGYIGQQVADSAYKIHFGAFGGMPVKIAFAIFGTSLLYIMMAGMKIYFLKCRAKGRPAIKLESGWYAIVWGVPAMLVFTCILALTMPSSAKYLAKVFWLGLCCIIFACILGRRIKKPIE